MKKILILLHILLLVNVQAAHEYKESYYQQKWCNQWHGLLEYKLNDDTRIDCLTKTYAVEFDFGPKWAESVGQSLYYASETGKKPAIVLILESDSDLKYYKRAQKLAKLYNIQLWYMKKPKNYSKNEQFEFNLENEIYKFVSSFLKKIFDEILRSIFT